MGFCWLCCNGFLLVVVVKFVGLVVGHGCGAGLFFCLACWVAMVVWCLATTVVGCACVVGFRLICGAGLVVL